MAGSDVCEAGIVEITADHTNATEYGSSVNGGSPTVVSDFSSDLGWYDKNWSPSWLLFDFKTYRVSVTGYMIKFGFKSSGYTQSWILTGSNDSQNWTIIDDRSLESKKHPDYHIDRFESVGDIKTSFRWIRIALAKSCWGAQYCLGLTSIEFFGDLTPPDSVGQSQRRVNH
jgi:hypothetical protein